MWNIICVNSYHDYDRIENKEMLIEEYSMSNVTTLIHFAFLIRFIVFIFAYSIVIILQGAFGIQICPSVSSSKKVKTKMALVCLGQVKPKVTGHYFYKRDYNVKEEIESLLERNHKYGKNAIL